MTYSVRREQVYIHSSGGTFITVQNPPARPLFVRLSIVLSVTVLLTLISATGALVVEELLRDGSLMISRTVALQARMQALAERFHGRDGAAPPAVKPLALAIGEVDTLLASPAYDSLDSFDKDYAPAAAFEALKSAWNANIKPRLSPDADGSAGALLDNGAALARKLLDALNADMASKRLWMSWLQVGCVALALLAAALGIYYSHDALVKRLGRVFSRLPVVGGGEQTPVDEIGRLAVASEKMLANEARAGKEIAMLRQEIRAGLGHQSLDLVFSVDRLLSESPLGEAILLRVLKELEEAIGVDASAIYLAEDMSERWSLGGPIISGGATLAPLQTESFDELAADCRIGTYGASSGNDAMQPQRQVCSALTVPIKEQEQALGLLILEADPDFKFEEWHVHLVEAVSRHIAIAISSANLAHEGRRVALLEERAAIAQELHDSIAQSLAYMKIQISRLESLIALRHAPDEVDLVVQELREGLNGAYRKLRELLTTFRVKVSIEGLGSALEETIEEFEHRSGLTLTLDNRLRDCKLTGNQEIHVLQIIREALSNTVRHAHATSAVVALNYDADQGVTVTIDDDGIGLRGEANPKYHHGMTIMEDRVNNLGGKLTIESRQGKGTRVSFCFVPGSIGRRGALPRRA